MDENEYIGGDDAIEVLHWLDSMVHRLEICISSRLSWFAWRAQRADFDFVFAVPLICLCFFFVFANVCIKLVNS